MLQVFENPVFLSNFLTIATFLVGGIWFAAIIKNKVDSLSKRLLMLESEIKKLVDVLVMLARQDERLNSIDRRVDDLRRGKGFITNGKDAS